MIMKTTNTCKNQKFISELKEESFEAIETISVSLKNFIQHPKDVFSKPMGTVNDGIIRYDVKRNQNYKNPIFF